MVTSGSIRGGLHEYLWTPYTPLYNKQVRNKETNTKVPITKRAQSNSSINLNTTHKYCATWHLCLTTETHKAMQYGTAKHVLHKSTFSYAVQTKYLVGFGY